MVWGGNGCAGTASDPCLTFGGYQYYPSVTYVQGQPVIQWLVLPIRASFLKEFFDVKLIVQNLTDGFTFSPGVANLQLPAGLSLAPTPTPQSAVQPVGSIAGGSSRTISWVARGDTEGSYDLSADYSARVDPIGLPLYLTARTREPLKVWGASALQTRILVDRDAVRWGPYDVDVEVKNVSDVPVYNMQVEMLDRTPDAPSDEALFFYAPAPPQVQGTGVIKPGETWTAHYVVYAGLGNDEITKLHLLLQRSFIERTGGDVDLHPTLAERDGSSAGPNAGPVSVTIQRDGSGEDQAVLSWLRPSAPSGLTVTGYEIWTRQSLGGGAWRKHGDLGILRLRAGVGPDPGTRSSRGPLLRRGHQVLRRQRRVPPSDRCRARPLRLARRLLLGRRRRARLRARNGSRRLARTGVRTRPIPLRQHLPPLLAGLLRAALDRRPIGPGQPRAIRLRRVLWSGNRRHDREKPLQ